MKKIIAAIVSTLLVILSLYVVNAVIVGQQKNKQFEISHTLLRYSGRGISKCGGHTQKYYHTGMR